MLQIFYINLASRPDRRSFMETQFQKLGISADRIEAVPSAKVPRAAIDLNARIDHPWAISLGDLACGLSHRKAWETIVARALPAALILEDDAVLSPDLVKCLSPGLLEELGADVLKLETWGKKVRLASASSPLTPGLRAQELLSTHPGGAAYVISRDLAERGLADPMSGRMEIDRYLFGRGGPLLLAARIMQAIPAPVVQLQNQATTTSSETGRTDIGSTRRDVANLKTPTFRAKLQRALGNLRYTSKLALRLLLDPKALLTGRQAIAFSGCLAHLSLRR